MIIDCRAKAELILYRLQEKVRLLKTTPVLTIIYFGENKSSESYRKGICKDCDFIGIRTKLLPLPINIEEKELINHLKQESEMTDAIMIQQPLPSHLNIEHIASYIPRTKDIDGTKNDSAFTSCTAEAVMEILKEQDISDKHCVILNRSETVGKPLINLLLERDATVTVCHSKTPPCLHYKHITNADIIITGTGNPSVLETANLKPNAIVIDVGFSIIDGKALGDFGLSVSKDNVNYTPVPRGVGLITRKKLIEHVIKAYRMNHTQEDDI